MYITSNNFIQFLDSFCIKFYYTQKEKKNNLIQKILCFCIIFCIFSTERSVCGKCVQCEASTLSFHMCAMRSEHTFHSRARRVRWEICTYGADNKGPVDLCSTEPTEPDFRRARHRTFESRIGLEKKAAIPFGITAFF